MMPGAEMLNKVPINSVTVEVLDQEGNPVKGAQVEASNGRQTTTGADGTATQKSGLVRWAFTILPYMLITTCRII